MTQPWKADIAIPPELAAACIDAQFPELAPARVQIIGEGWDNVAFGVNDSYLFRFPRRQVAVKLLETETAVLPWLASQLPIPTPAPIFVGRPIAEYPYPFTGYKFLPGITACRLDLNDSQRTALAPPLAGFLRVLHSADPKKARELGAAGDTFARLDVAHQSPGARTRIASLADRGIIPTETADRLIDLIASTPTDPPVRTNTVVHGDLYVRHILVSADSRKMIAGIIDWGDVHLGDPAIDLAVAFTFIPPSARGQFWITYGIPDNRTYALARFRAVCGMSWVVHYAEETGEQELLREGVIGLRNIIG